MPVFFAPENQPDIAYANLDKISLIIKQAYSIRFQTDENYNVFKAALGRTDIFTQGFGNQSSTFTVRETRNLGKRWLFDGSLKFKRGVGQGVWCGTLDLELNPSRFINHIAHATDAVNAEDIVAFANTMCPQDFLERHLHLPDSAKGIDGNNGSDNLIPKQLYRHMRPALDIFDTYFNQVLIFIRQRIVETLAESQVQGSYVFEEVLEDWNLPYVEVYQEYAVSNAIAFINGLRGFLLPMFTNAEAVEYVLGRGAEHESPDMTWQVDRNAPCLKLDLGVKGVKLVIYAKTFDRVRFEIRYNGKVRERIRGRISAASLPRNVRGVRSLLQPTIEDAHRRLQRVFQRLPDLDYSARCDFQAFVEFLADIAEACHERDMPHDMVRLLSLLASNGSIEAIVGSPDHVLCQDLESRGILIEQRAVQNTRGFRRYCLNTRYANVLRATISAF